MAPLFLLLSLLAPALQYQERRLDRKVPGCDVALVWIEVVSGPAPARQAMNAAILGWLLARPSNEPARDPEAYAADFIRGYEEENRHRPQQWYVSKNAKVLRATAPVFSLECSDSSFVGGAHGIHGTRYLNFDPATGDPVKLSSILIPGSVPRLTAIAEAHFRDVRKLAPDADLKAAGFIFMKEGRFQLNDNYGFTDTSLVFFYNPYEIAPYAMGTTEVAIPYSEIRDMLRPEFAGL